MYYTKRDKYRDGQWHIIHQIQALSALTKAEKQDLLECVAANLVRVYDNNRLVYFRELKRLLK